MPPVAPRPRRGPTLSARPRLLHVPPSRRRPSSDLAHARDAGAAQRLRRSDTHGGTCRRGCRYLLSRSVRRPAGRRACADRLTAASETAERVAAAVLYDEVPDAGAVARGEVGDVAERLAAVARDEGAAMSFSALAAVAARARSSEPAARRNSRSSRTSRSSSRRRNWCQRRRIGVLPRTRHRCDDHARLQQLARTGRRESARGRARQADDRCRHRPLGHE